MTDRRSRIVDDGTLLLHGDLHNHSLFSDGDGDPERAFAQMRHAGLDFAALTDHASIPHEDLDGLDVSHYPDQTAVAMAYAAPRSIDELGWKRTGEIADAHDVPGEFTAIRGFEWTEPWLGHANVWFSDDHLHVRTPGRLAGLQDWLRETAPDALLGYNHPGREPGRFHDFARAEDLVPRMVALEAFNRTWDHLFHGYRDGVASPIASCLDAGWRPGLIGCSDEHTRSYGLEGRGRTGLWVREHSRAGVREALLARRSFATREAGLRLDATLDGVRMGASPAARGGAELAVDLDGSAYAGREVVLHLLAPDGSGLPAIVWSGAAEVGAVTRAEVPVPDVPWLLLRVSDPTRRSDSPGPAGHAASCWAVAYASPWYRER